MLGRLFDDSIQLNEMQNNYIRMQIIERKEETNLVHDTFKKQFWR